MSSKTYLVTGANRGLGLGLVSALVGRDNTSVVAAVRDVASESSKKLYDLPKGANSQIIVVKIDSTSETDASQAVNKLKLEYHFEKLDAVIANSGISKYYGPAATTPLSEVSEHYQVNVLGPLSLFQATWPLLEKSPSPIFVSLSTGVASMGDMASVSIAATAYGASKAALNYITRKIHFENEKLTAFAISPGWVQTDMGNQGATASGMKEAPVTVKDSIDGMLNKIDNATREKTSGTFLSFDDQVWNW